MGIFNRFPYTDFHRLNADWILDKVKEMLGLTQQAAEDAEQAAATVAGYDAQLDEINDDISALDGRLDNAETAITGKVDENTGTAKDLKIVRDLTDPNNGAALVADTTYASGVQTERLAVKQVSANTIQSGLRRVAIGNPLEATDAATKNYVDTAGATKADKTRPTIFDSLTIVQENNRNGVQVQLVGGSPYSAALHPVSGGNVDGTIAARFGVGTPTENFHATPKQYVDTADAAKVDIAAPVMNGPVKVIDQSTNNGFGISVVGGPVCGAAFHPISNGVINSAVSSPIVVGTPTSANHATTKQYVDNQLEAYAEAPAEFVLSENNGVWIMADGKNTNDVVTALNAGKRVIVKVQVSESYSYEFTVFSWMYLETLGFAASTMVEFNGVTGVYTRHDLLMQYDYNTTTQEFDYTYAVYNSDATAPPVASAANYGMAYGVTRAGVNYKYGLLNVMQPPVEVALTGSAPTFTAQDNSNYTGGTLTSLTLDDYPATGEFTIVFESGSTPTTTSFPASILGLETFAAEADTIYEINVRNGLAVWHGWDVSTE